MNWTLFPTSSSADTNLMVVFETDVLQTGEKNQSVLYHIVNFQANHYPVSSPESCSDVEAGWIGENSFVCLYHSPLFAWWNSVVCPIYVLQTGTEYWLKVLPCWQINILINVVCDSYYGNL